VPNKAFLDVPEGGVEGASGRVSLLVGQDNLRLFPVEKRRSGGMALFKSQLGTGWVMSDNAEKLLLNEEPADWEEEASMMLAQETKHFQVPEFLSAEALGVYLPRRCSSCRNCKEC
jgi:hypothetical protein